ncbi:MAG: glycosyltransferase family 2 protein [Bacteroidales bacterium]|jgi:GT2 family glycosyltransferase
MNTFVCVVVPVYNRKNYLNKFLLSFQKQTFKNYKIIVVDDGSNDGTDLMINTNFPEVILLKGDGNLWWTGAINKGIKYCLDNFQNIDYFLIINDDLEVYENYLQTLVEAILQNPKTLIGSVAVDIEQPDVIIYGGSLNNALTAKGISLNKGKKLSSFPKNTTFNVSTLTGRGVLIPKIVFDEIGLYDDKHFKQCGDTELPARAKNKGYKLLVSYSAIVLSHTSATNDINRKKTYSLSDFKKKFFNVRSNSNLKYLFFYAWNSSKNPFYFVSYFICDLLRNLYHYFVRLKL